MRPSGKPPAPAASGCYLAYSRFGSNLIKVINYLNVAEFKNELNLQTTSPRFLLATSPRTLSNNMAISFFVSIVEDYLKSCFIALLTYSRSSEKFLRSMRLQGDQLTRISKGELSVEAMVAETLSFQKVSIACKHFKAIDDGLDLAGALRKPYRRRKKSLLDSLDDLVKVRHDFVHRAQLDYQHSTDALIGIAYDIAEAMERVDRSITIRHRWPTLERSWVLGRRS